MSNLKINEDQYLGKQELNRLVKFLGEGGVKLLAKMLITSYGVSLYESDSLEVIAGTAGDKVTVTRGLAITNNIDFINVPVNVIDALTIPADSVVRTIVVAHVFRTIEEGVVTIASDGSLVGVDTKFTEVLRGEDSNTVLIRFPNSATNTSDYPILEVASDTNAIVNTAVAMTPEVGAAYEVVGSFTPNQVISPAQKIIYEYDSYEIALRVGAAFTDDVVLATAVNTGAGAIITDLRSTNLLQLL